MWGLLLLVGQAGAADVARVQCELREDKRADEAVLIGGCGEFEVSPLVVPSAAMARHPGTGSVAIMSPRGNGFTVMVMRPSSTGRPVFEDVTETLEIRARRPRGGALRGVTVDLSGFERTGVVTVVARGNGQQLGRMDVRELIDLEAVRMAKAPVRPPIVEVVPERKGPEAIPSRAGGASSVSEVAR